MAEDDAPPKPASVKEEASPPADPALTEAAPATTIEADTITDDADSAIDDRTISNFTASITSSVLNYPVEHGRRYHAYRSGAYPMPNDEGEIERLDLMHAVITKAIGDKLYLAPLDDGNLGRVLDIGTGTGIWSMEMGDTHPNAEILGNDLSAIQSKWVPPNVKFEVDDVESEWLYEDKFDFIFSRYMAASILDWEKLIRQMHQHLKPGGWVEFQDFDFAYYSEDGSMTPESASSTWIKELLAASRAVGREPSPGPQLENWARAAGFINITHKVIKLPLGPWPRDPALKEIGMLNVTQVLEGLEGFTLRLFTGVLGWSVEAIQILLAKVRKEMKDQRIHMMYDMHVTYAQKPE